MKRYLPFVIIAVVLIAAVVSAWILIREKSGAADTTNVLTATDKSTPIPDNGSNQSAPTSEVAIPKPNVKVSSPVVLDEYGDYQCPPCGMLYPELKKIEGEYGNQLRIVFHHFPLTKIHKNALSAARAAEAARNQNKFWEMHDRLYRNQKEWADSADPWPIFISYAQELALNVDRFNRDINSIEVDQRINADFQKGTSLRVTGTPTVFVDGRMLNYEATTPEGLRRAINLMLERKAVS